jgi:hypothetical protein
MSNRPSSGSRNGLLVRELAEDHENKKAKRQDEIKIGKLDLLSHCESSSSSLT